MIDLVALTAKMIFKTEGRLRELAPEAARTGITQPRLNLKSHLCVLTYYVGSVKRDLFDACLDRKSEPTRLLVHTFRTR